MWDASALSTIGLIANIFKSLDNAKLNICSDTAFVWATGRLGQHLAATSKGASWQAFSTLPLLPTKNYTTLAWKLSVFITIKTTELEFRWLTLRIWDASLTQYSYYHNRLVNIVFNHSTSLVNWFSTIRPCHSIKNGFKKNKIRFAFDEIIVSQILLILLIIPWFVVTLK